MIVCGLSIQRSWFGFVIGLDAKPTGASVILDELQKNGISTDQLLTHYSLSETMKVARAFQLGEEYDPWFRELYAYIENSARVATSRPEEHTTSEQHPV